jgi:hypothetical protein
LFAQFDEFRSINRGENPSSTYWMRPSASVLPQAFRRVAAKEFLKLVGESHSKMMLRSA